MALAGGLAFVAALAVTAAVSSDARVRAGFEAALGSKGVSSLPRPVKAASTFDTSAVHLSRHVSGDATPLVQSDNADRAPARHAASLGVLGSAVRTGERILLPTADGRLETFEVTTIEPVGLAADEEQPISGHGRAGDLVPDMSPHFALVTLKTVDAVGDGHPARVLRMIVRGPVGGAAAPAVRLPAKAL